MTGRKQAEGAGQSDGWASYAGRRVLLLQGPVGPFFKRLARDLRRAGALVWKVNFHAGDQVFYPGGVTWRGPMAQWPAWLEARLAAWRIDCVLLFGDCRPVHQAARTVCQRRGVPVGVFEEGYLRPDHVTFEWGGVNANSALPQTAQDVLRSEPARRRRQHRRYRCQCRPHSGAWRSGRRSISPSARCWPGVFPTMSIIARWNWPRHCPGCARPGASRAVPVHNARCCRA
jgi:hypothetical protein